jgi:hypothetical protein
MSYNPNTGGIAPGVVVPWSTELLAANQTVANSTTFVDSGLTFAMQAGTTYGVRGVAVFDTTDAGDVKYTFTGPADPTRVRLQTSALVGGGSAFSQVRVETGYGTTRSVAGTGGAATVEFNGVIQNGAEAGAFVFRFAQNTQSDDSGAVLLAGSWLEYATVQ